MGLAERAFAQGWNAVRLNQRNCGGTESLTPTLYNSGLSGDYRAVLFELIERDLLPEIFFAGYSMGGNLVLKMAGELARAAPRELRGIAAAVCPTIDSGGLRGRARIAWKSGLSGALCPQPESAHAAQGHAVSREV